MNNDQTVFDPAGPVAHAWMLSDAFVKLLVGPIGSGKTAAAVVEILRRAKGQAPGPDGIRRSRVVIIRNTYAELKSTTIKSWEQWMPKTVGKFTEGSSPIVHRVQFDDVDLEAVFMPLDDEGDIRKLLSLEVTFAWIDEFRQVPRAILDALTGRVGRFPSRLQGGCTWSGILLTSNPSDTESDMYKLATNPPEGYEVFRQPSGVSPDAENLMNLPTSYYQRIAAGKDDEWLKVFVHGEFGFVVEGQPVYPSWRDSVHVAREPLKPIPGLGLTVGADFGLTPCAVIGQQLPDGRIWILAEFCCDDSGIVRFAEGLTRFIRTTFPDHDVVRAVGDPAGTARGHDERTVFQILDQYTPWRWKPASTNEITMRIEAVSAALNRMVDGKTGFQLSPACPTLRKGFSGGYHFRRLATATGGMYDSKPNKNAFSHSADACQYLLLAMDGSAAVLNRDPSRRANRPRIANDVDYPMFTEDRPQSGRTGSVGVTWGNGRPAHLDRTSRQQSGTARGLDYNPLKGD